MSGTPESMPSSIGMLRQPYVFYILAILAIIKVFLQFKEKNAINITPLKRLTLEFIPNIPGRCVMKKISTFCSLVLPICS